MENDPPAEVCAERQTEVTPDRFDALLKALDEPAQPNDAMRRIAQSPRVSKHV